MTTGSLEVVTCDSCILQYMLLLVAVILSNLCDSFLDNNVTAIIYMTNRLLLSSFITDVTNLAYKDGKIIFCVQN
jgi:hypothetical protein